MRSVPKCIGQIKVGRPRTHSCLNVSGTGYDDVSGTGYGGIIVVKHVRYWLWWNNCS